jgi:GT2 family glycosyltransferase
MPATANVFPLHDAASREQGPSAEQPYPISVVITTRNRPEVFSRALDSVLAQLGASFELVVVEDGSDEKHRSAYARHLARARALLGSRVQLLRLSPEVAGHGSGGTMNAGAAAARGDYLAFLDDDDVWIDTLHLQRVQRSVERAAAGGERVDLYFSNQEAMQDGEIIAPRWLSSVRSQLVQSGRQPDPDGIWRVSTADLLTANGFCHTNCLVVRRALYQQIGGRVAAIRWEGDHNLYLRLLDRAQLMLYSPAVTARHHVPDAAARSSVTTSLKGAERRLWQAQSMAHAASAVNDPALRQRARMVQGYALKHATMESARAGQRRRAADLAWQAQQAQPGPKWWAYACWCSLTSLLGDRAAPLPAADAAPALAPASMPNDTQDIPRRNSA